VSFLWKDTILELTPSGRLATITGNKDEGRQLKDGEGIFENRNHLRASHVVAAD
jgi:hypothetical protein